MVRELSSPSFCNRKSVFSSNPNAISDCWESDVLTRMSIDATSRPFPLTSIAIPTSEICNKLSPDDTETVPEDDTIPPGPALISTSPPTAVPPLALNVREPPFNFCELPVTMLMDEPMSSTESPPCKLIEPGRLPSPDAINTDPLLSRES